jgi:hypothetical protein
MPYTYAWSNAATTASISGVPAATYSVTITDANGCSSTSSANITEPNSLVAASTVDANEACLNTMDGELTASATGGTTPYTYAWSNAATTASITGLTAGYYTVTITDANGCSDMITDTIVYGLATFDTIAYTACDSMVSPSGLFTWNTSGTYMDTLTNSVGCDSVLTVNLTINTFTTSHQTITACDGLVSPNGLFVWTVSGTYYDVIPNAAGCDSIMTIDLTIIHSSDSTINVTACDSYSGLTGSKFWTATGVYSDTIPNMAGCDSVVTINLTINNSIAITQSPDICKGDSFQVGTSWYSLEGTYVDSFLTMSGCDSVVTTVVSVETVDVSVTQFAGGLLRADNPFATYQWVNCDSNYAIVPGATGARFEPTLTGNYAAVISTTTCSDTSDCYYVNILGINEISNNIELEVYPNPAGADNNIITVKVNNANGYELNIRDLAGKLIYSDKDILENTNFIDVSRFAAGAYFIEVKTQNSSDFTKLVVL